MADTPTAAEMERAINEAYEWWVVDTRMRDHAREMHGLLTEARPFLAMIKGAVAGGLVVRIDALIVRIKGEKADG